MYTHQIGKNTNINTKYRPDIDGLRAIAVMSVVGFHVFPGVIKGGFVGVDIFFVISGFLISGIIFNALTEGRFSYLDFYVRRIRRIFPALILVLISCLASGWFLLFPDEYKFLGKHAAAGAGFILNIILKQESGYFDIAAELKPLLHLWSLGVEEQFYIVWPLLLVFFFRWSHRLLPILCVLLLTSFVLNICFINTRPTATYYLSITRFWELISGSLLAYMGTCKNRISSFYLLTCLNNSPLAEKRIREIFSWLGVLLITISVLLINRNNSFPGWLALLPTSGALLVIAAGQEQWINRKIISNRVLVFIGLISYPIYLWHWPLLSFAKIIVSEMPALWIRILLIVVTVILAWLTYIFIERPMRFGDYSKKKTSLLIVVLTAIGIYGVVIFKYNDSTRLNEIYKITAAINDWNFPQNATINGKSRNLTLFIGDSFVQHYYSRINQVVKSRYNDSNTVKFTTVGGCPPLPRIQRFNNPNSDACSVYVDKAYNEAEAYAVKTVIFGSAWHYFYPILQSDKLLDEDKFIYKNMLFLETDTTKKPIYIGSWQFEKIFKEFEFEILKLKQLNKKIYIVFPSPINDNFDPKNMIDRINGKIKENPPIFLNDHRMEFAPITEKLISISMHTGAILIDPANQLCDQFICPSLIESIPIYKDSGHLRPFFVEKNISLFDEIITQ